MINYLPDNRGGQCRGPEKGFTLIEAIIVVASLSILVGVFFYLFDGVSQLRLFGEAQITSVDQGRISINEFTKYVSQGNRVLASRTIGGTNYDSNAFTVVLQIPAIDSNGDVIDSIWDYAVFYLSGSDLHYIFQPDNLSARPAAQRRLSDSVTNLSFVYDDPDFTKVRNVGIDISVQRMARSQAVSTHFIEEVELKNY